VFLGHFGVGFGAKAAAPKTSLGSLLLASQLIDLLWPTLLLLGVERAVIAPGITKVTPLDFTHYPISHSLAAVLLWAVLFGLVYHVLRRDSRGALVCAIAVVSHWLLDLLTHRPDLPLAPGSGVKVGLGLWDSLPATLGVELAVFAVGVWLYATTTRAVNRTGSVALWAMVGVLLLIYAGNILGPPPPSLSAVAWVGQAQWLLIAWGYWIDRHRQARL
jgi:membrane-bound metal-dependent hydrolase YbcI (DUF457 family)